MVNCLPSTLETVGLMTRPRLLAMKPGVLFVNVGRGSFVRNKDLVFALESSHLGGAILDVTETEPLPEDSPLWDMENVLITPHIAGPSFDSSPDEQTAIWEIRMENLDNFLTGKPVTMENIEACAKTVLEDINPRDSWRASKAFRRHIAVEMCRRGLIESVKRCGGEI